MGFRTLLFISLLPVAFGSLHANENFHQKISALWETISSPSANSESNIAIRAGELLSQPEALHLEGLDFEKREKLLSVWQHYLDLGESYDGSRYDQLSSTFASDLNRASVLFSLAMSVNNEQVKFFELVKSAHRRLLQAYLFDPDSLAKKAFPSPLQSHGARFLLQNYQGLPGQDKNAQELLQEAFQRREARPFLRMMTLEIPIEVDSTRVLNRLEHSMKIASKFSETQKVELIHALAHRPSELAQIKDLRRKLEGFLENIHQDESPLLILGEFIAQKTFWENRETRPLIDSVLQKAEAFSFFLYAIARNPELLENAELREKFSELLLRLDELPFSNDENLMLDQIFKHPRISYALDKAPLLMGYASSRFEFLQAQVKKTIVSSIRPETLKSETAQNEAKKLLATIHTDSDMDFVLTNTARLQNRKLQELTLHDDALVSMWNSKDRRHRDLALVTYLAREEFHSTTSSMPAINGTGTLEEALPRFSKIVESLELNTGERKTLTEKAYNFLENQGRVTDSDLLRWSLSSEEFWKDVSPENAAEFSKRLENRCKSLLHQQNG